MQRTAQEMLLGLGGPRALNWLGVPISTYHFNEGHVVFACVKMIAARMETGRSFEETWADTRQRIVFTTHTRVKAGNQDCNQDHRSRTCAAWAPRSRPAAGGSAIRVLPNPAAGSVRLVLGVRPPADPPEPEEAGGRR